MDVLSHKLQKSSLIFLYKKRRFIEQGLCPQKIVMWPSDQARQMCRNHLLRVEKQEAQLSFSRNNLSKTLPPPPSGTSVVNQDTDAASIVNEH